MKYRKPIRSLCIGMAVMFAVSTPVSALTYTDVASTHWAYEAIDDVSDAGIIVGDLSGNFNPDASIDKFDTAKILAVMAGYKYTNVSTDEQAYYNQAYSNYKSYIDSYSSKFEKWDTTASMEIAFLLEEGVLVATDLDQFVVTVSGTERLRALSREEAAIFLVRVMGREASALGTSYSATFNDDSSITESAKPYVYYLKKLGIFAGDTDNNFNPNNAVTKAAMSTLVQKTMLAINPDYFSTATNTTTNTTTGGTTSNTSGTTQSSGFAIVTGTITKVYPSFNAVQISSTDSNYNNKIYPVTTGASVSINGTTAAFTAIEEGMTFVGVVSDAELAMISAYSASSAASTASAAAASTVSFSLDGTVTATRTENGIDYVSVETRTLSPSGIVNSTTTEYIIADNAAITRGSASAYFSSILVGDRITASGTGNTCTTVHLEEKSKSIIGTLVEKKTVSYSNYPAIVVKDANGTQWELIADGNSYLYRRGSGDVAVSGLRLGDSIEVKAEYNTITDLYAYGTSTKTDIYIISLFISETDQSYIVGRDDSGNVETYLVVPGSVDMYELQAGYKVRLRLDSKEISSLSILEETSTTAVIGYITDFSSSSITVRDAYGSNEKSTYTINSSTVITDGTQGKTASYSDFSTGMKVYLTTSSANSDIAQTITILAY